MGIKYSFVDNEVYGTDDVNEIAGCLTGAGVAPFLSKNSYSTSDLNSVTAALVTDGVNLDGCNCTVENAGTAEMRVNISQGIVFFESGVRLIVDKNGYSIDVEPSKAGVVFAHYSPSLQKADIVFMEEILSDGECVELARIKADGTLLMSKSFARSKVGTMGSNVTQVVPFTRLETPIFLMSDENPSYDRYIIAEAEGVNVSNYNYALAGKGVNPDGLYSADWLAFIDIKNNKLMFCVNRSDFSWAQWGSNLAWSTYSTAEGGRFIEVIDGRLCLVTQLSKKASVEDIVYTGDSVAFY